MYQSTAAGKFGWWMVCAVILFTVLFSGTFLFLRWKNKENVEPQQVQNPLLSIKEKTAGIKIDQFAIMPIVRYEPEDVMKDGTVVVTRFIDKEHGIVCYSETLVNSMSCVKVQHIEPGER